jgi:hypothetical protein
LLIGEHHKGDGDHREESEHRQDHEQYHAATRLGSVQGIDLHGVSPVLVTA